MTLHAAASSTDRLARAATIALLALAVLAAMGGAIRHDFALWDDDRYVTENPWVARGLHLSGVAWACAAYHSANWHPLTWLSHMLDVSLFGLVPAGHHAISLALHALNAVLVLLVAERLTGRRGAALAAALLFAVHPLHVESVVWIAERKDLLSTGFALLAILAYLRPPGPARPWLVALALAASLAAKPTFMTLPVLLLLIDCCPPRRIAGEPPSTRLPVFRDKIPLLALAFASATITVLAQRSAGSVISLQAIPMPWRLANAASSVWVYLGQTIWPYGLACFYPYPVSANSAPPEVIRFLALGAASAVAIGVLTVIAARLRRRIPELAVGWGWYLITLLPTIGIVQVGMQARADRYTYAALIGPFIAGAAWLARWAEQHRARVAALRAAAALAITGFTLVARFQTGFWRNTETLFTRALVVTRENYVVHNALGAWLLRQGRSTEAERELMQALRIAPTFADAHYNLAVALTDRGASADAERALEDALALDPALPAAHNRLAILLAARGALEEALVHAERAVALGPSMIEPRINLGLVLAALGRSGEAEQRYLEALALDPAAPKAHFNYANLLDARGREALALEHYRAAIAADPRYVRARERLAQLHERAGRRAEARAEADALLALDPHNAVALGIRAQED